MRCIGTSTEALDSPLHLGEGPGGEGDDEVFHCVYFVEGHRINYKVSIILSNEINTFSSKTFV